MADKNDELKMTGSNTSDTAKVQSDLIRNNHLIREQIARDLLNATKGEERKARDQKNDRDK